MSLLDKILNLFNVNKKYPKIITEDLHKVSGEAKQLEVAIYDGKTPIVNKKVTFKVNSVPYSRTTNEEGIAKLNINLPVGEYDAHVCFDDPDYVFVKTFVNVTVNPIIVSSDLNMVEKDGSCFTVTLKDGNANNVVGKKIVFTVNGIDYERTTNENGIASLPINLNSDDYKILTKCYDVITENMIHIAAPTPVQESHFGYWVFGKDMLKVNLTDLKSHGVTDILLNYYAFQTHGESKVLDWIQQANNLGIHVHVWMQCFYNGEWQNPKTTNLTSKINEAKKYANMNGVYGVHLDYLRYPGTAYKTQGGTEAINEFVKNVRAAIGDKFLSCAVMPESETKYYYGQDIAELGKLCDAVIPMQYKGNYNQGSSWLASTTKMFSQTANIWSGLQSYKSDDDTTVLSAAELTNDINTCLSNGAKGAILFRYGLSPNITFPTPSTGKKSTRMEGTDINMTYKDGTKYQCAVYDDNGRVAGTVKITVNGVDYNRTPDGEGLYKLAINLNPGTYQVKAEYLGDDTHLASSVNNTIKVNEAPPTPEPTKLYPYITQQGAGKLGQLTPYSCGPHSLMQAIYRLTGIELSESTLMSVCGTTTGGTGHSGLETGLAWFNRKYGYNLKMTWKNKSELSWDEIQTLINNGAVFFHLLYRNSDGHYETAQNCNSPMSILNSLGSRNGNGYYGYIETRSRATQQSYINGISQKSVCIITR